jgi:hypothetical protein
MFESYRDPCLDHRLSRMRSPAANGARAVDKSRLLWMAIHLRDFFPAHPVDGI